MVEYDAVAAAIVVLIALFIGGASFVALRARS